MKPDQHLRKEPARNKLVSWFSNFVSWQGATNAHRLSSVIEERCGQGAKGQAKWVSYFLPAPKHYPLYLLALLAIAFLAPVLFTARLYCYRDFFCYYYGDKKILIDAYLQGKLLLWNPYRFCGAPFLANIQTACFHPANLLFLFLPYPLALKLFLLLSFWMGAIGTFWLLCLWKLRKSSALIGALAFVLSGVFFSAIHNVVYLAAYAWIPLVFLAFHQTLTQKSSLWFIFLAVLASAQFFSGDPQTFLVTNVLLVPYYFIVRWDSIATKSTWLAAPLLFAGFALLVAGLAAIQLLPTWELLNNSIRKSGLSYSEASAWSLTPMQLSQIFCAALRGYATGDWYTNLVAGSNDIPFVVSIFPATIALFLFSSGCFFGYNRFKTFAGIGLLFFLALALGFYFPLYYYCWRYLPIVAKFRYPSKYLVFCTFFFAAITAINFEQLFYDWQHCWQRYRRRIIAGIAVPLCGYLLVYIAVAAPDVVRALVVNKMSINAADIPIAFAPGAAEEVVTTAVFYLLLVTLWFTAIRHQRVQKWLPCLVAAAFIGQMLPHGWRLNPTCAEAVYTRKSWGESQLLHHGLGYDRYYSFSAAYKVKQRSPTVIRENLQELDDLALGSKSFIWGLAQSHQYASAKLSRVESFYQNFSWRQICYFTSTKYFIVCQWQYRQKAMALPIVAGNQQISLCLNPEYAPRAWLPDRVILVTDIKEALEKAVVWRRLNINTPYIETGNSADRHYSKSDKATARICLYSPERVEIAVTTPTPRWLIFNDAFYPGWECYIAGKLSKIYPAILAFRAVQVPAGSNSVLFVYRPASVRIGTYLSIGCWSLVIVYLLIKLGGKFITRAPQGLRPGS